MALAPEQTRIGIRRHFTDAGTHPYDTVQWERRDARITNFRDGTVAFEQLDVEFPTTWSLNATNIVAQKYFRGSLGTEEREWSLRQVIDRVADTVTSWGARDGYFVDDDEAETFNAELKYLLVHQKVAFNSPVWFNIGVQGVPQQASACQPYHALVSTTDGLVPIGKLVEDGAVGTKVFDADGVTQIVAVKANGRKQVLRVHTKAGHQLDVTPDHLVWRSSGVGTGSFVEAGDLKAGDTVEWHRTISWGEGQITTCEIAEAALAGWLQSDGFVGQYDHGTNRSLTIEALTVNDDEFDWVDGYLEAVLPGVHRKVRRFDTIADALDGKRIRLYGEKLRPFVEAWNLLPRHTEMTVPERLFTAPLPVVAAYLRSIFQAEGYVSTRERAAMIGMDMVSEKLVRGVQTLLARFGIFSRVRFKDDPRPDRVGMWSLAVRPLPERVRFADEIGFIGREKQDKLVASLELPGKNSGYVKQLQIGRIEELGEMDVYDIQTESGEYLSGNLRVHNCFILSVEDKMDSILNWYVEEGTIFKGGSGAGINLSRIRSSHELLKGGGTASGPVSFMRGADASAGTIKSGGKTRRAAKMVILDVDHPDVEEFIWCKAREEQKARVLRDAGFDMDLDGADSHSTQYQNANNSVRVTDEFMQAVIDDADWHLRAVTDGSIIKTVRAKELMRQISLATWECADPGMQFDTTINHWHTAANTGRINASNPCSEYMHLDESACNLASLNLLTFLPENTDFDVEGFKAAVEVIFTGQEILVGNADYPTEGIGQNARRFRQLGLGYANLGAMLMALGLPYDSDEGRALAGAITGLMTGHAYATSAVTAARMGPFAGYTENQEHMLAVLDQHREKMADIDEELVPVDLLSAAQQSWDVACATAAIHGVRNSQASVLAPTGCLVGGSLVPTERGLVRLRSLGDPDGAQWQALGIDVQTDDGPRRASEFYVNGLETVVDVETKRGYRLQGTAKHRIKVVDETGVWAWRRFADLRPGDTVPLALDQLVGSPQPVSLPPIGEPHWTGEHHLTAPRAMTPDLAELVGYFMGDGSLHARGLRFCVSAEDFDVVEHLEQLGKSLFGVQAAVAPKQGYTEVAFHSVRLVEWWEACGFAKRRPTEGHVGKGYTPHIPDALLWSNDREVYRAFVRGLFEADGTVGLGCPSWTTTSLDLSHDVQSVLLALGFPTTRKFDISGRGSRLAVLRLLNKASNRRWAEEIGFLSDRKSARIDVGDLQQSARYDHIPVTRELIDRLLPDNDRDRKVALMEFRRGGSITRRLAADVHARTADPELTHLLGFFYDRIDTAALGDEELTYDLSVPDNVTYVANGFISHNTIGLMMDCDTTGVEPDLGLTKMKKLVGGGTMTIVNQTVPRALRNLGYNDAEVTAIVDHINVEKTILGAPALKAEHIAVFACSMGDNPIHYSGHVRMMGAVQPFISGAISKCVTGETILPTADGLVRIGSLRQGEAPDSFRDEVLEVASLDGYQKTDAFYYGGQRPVREAVLRSGHRVVGTPNHRLLVAVEGGLDWKPLDEIETGDMVATQYGAELWSPLPARFDDFVPTAPYGCQKAVRIPAEMTDELAFLLGAFASEGHVSRSNWTVHITNSVTGVRDRVLAAWSSEFGVDARIVDDGTRCPSVVVASKTIVEFLDHLGCGTHAGSKRVPDAVLMSPREMVLVFLQGLALDAYTSVSTMPKWAICLDSGGMLDDLQAVLTNLGIRHGRVSKFNTTYQKYYDEVYAVGEAAQRLACLVPFAEPDKAASAEDLLNRSFSGRHDTADVVAGLHPRDLYALLPRGRSGRAGQSVRTEFAYLCDDRTRWVTRRSLERVAAVPGVDLPDWLCTVLDDELHFSPVESIVDAGVREVFDVSVPTTHAFVGNGIVNHNTVNMPEDVTVEDVEQLHIDAWQLGVKAVAIYRDNCKVAQPLAMAKKEGAEDDGVVPGGAAAATEVVERVIEKIIQEPYRQKLAKTRPARTFEFRVADCKGFVTVGEYEDGRPGEIFISVSKQGSTLAGIMDAFAISISHGLQYGVPLRSFVDTFTGMRFEPAGMTDDEDIRFATSLMDYLFRKLAILYLSPEERNELGIHTIAERTQPTLPGVEETVTANVQGQDVTPDPPSIESASTLTLELEVDLTEAKAEAKVPAPVADVNAPLCMQCGIQMQRAGSCHACPSCGTTSGCS